MGLHLLAVVLFFSTIWTASEGACPPLRIKKGVVMRCVLPDAKSSVDCGAPDVPTGVEAYYTCQRNFINPFGEGGGKLFCSSQGRWLRMGEYQDFSCTPECGRARNSSLQTLSSFIEMEYETGGEIFPWHVAIFRRFGETSLYKYSCGGTLVNPGNKGVIVLTSAHCVTKNPSSSEPGALESFKIVLGAVSTEFRYNVAGNSQIFSAKRIVTEREYDPSSLQSDIGMIELSGPVKISDTVQPVCFPTRKIASTQVRPGTRGEVPLIRNDQFAYQEIIKVPVSEQGQCLRDCDREPTNTEFCGTRPSGSSLSSVDSGTGLVFNEFTEKPKRYYLQGILTKVAGESDGCSIHDTFTSVSVFLDWVNRVHDEIADGQRIKEIVAPFRQKATQPTQRPKPTTKPYSDRERDRPSTSKVPTSLSDRERDRPKPTRPNDDSDRNRDRDRDQRIRPSDDSDRNRDRDRDRPFENRDRDRPFENRDRDRDRPSKSPQNNYEDRERDRPKLPLADKDRDQRPTSPSKVSFEDNDRLSERPKSPKPSFIPTTSVTTSNPSIFQQDFSRIGLDLHNFYRQKHQSPPLHLNGKLSQEAQDWADYLLRENKWEFSDGKDYSENIFQYFGVISANEVVKKAVNNWYEANSKYNWNNPEASTFSQLVWKGTTHIGIGVASKGTKSVVVTNYWPKGNIYNIGEGDRAQYFKDNVLPAVPSTLSVPLDENISLI